MGVVQTKFEGLVWTRIRGNQGHNQGIRDIIRENQGKPGNNQGKSGKIRDNQGIIREIRDS